MESLEARSDAALETAAATVRFALTTVGAATADGAKARLTLADSHLGVVPFEGVRVDQLELDVPGTLSPAEVAAGPSALRNRRCELRRLHFSVEESALSRMLARSLDPASGVESISVRLFPDHVRVYLEIADEGRGTQTRVVLAASTDVDEAGNLVLSFYDIRVFGRLPGQVPASLVGRIVPTDAARFVERAGATRVAVKPLAALLTSWLPAAGCPGRCRRRSWAGSCRPTRRASSSARARHASR